jgi:HSP20 family molecular chaperone IbpA
MVQDFVSTITCWSKIGHWNVLDPPEAAIAAACPGHVNQCQPVQNDHHSCTMQTADAIVVHADIPGVKKEDIQLDIDHNILTLSVSTKDEKEEEKVEEGVQWHHTERSSAFMKRSVRLPETADTANITAAYQNGVLNVTVPKNKVENKTKRVTIA